jgi:hypothetical protein
MDDRSLSGGVRFPADGRAHARFALFCIQLENPQDNRVLSAVEYISLSSKREKKQPRTAESHRRESIPPLGAKRSAFHSNLQGMRTEK